MDSVVQAICARVPDLHELLKKYVRVTHPSEFTLRRLYSPAYPCTASKRMLAFMYRWAMRWLSGGQVMPFTGWDTYSAWYDPSRSAGYPHDQTKGDFFKSDLGQYYLANPFRALNKQFFVKRCNKDEILPLDKVDRTRAFFVAPAEVHYLESVLVREQLNWQTLNWASAQIPTLVGFGMLAGDIKHIYSEFVGLRVLAIDFAGLEYSVPHWLMEIVCEARARMSCSPETVRKLYAMYDKAPIILDNGDVVPPSICNKSGRLGTLHDNCLFSAIIMHAVVMDLFQAAGFTARLSDVHIRSMGDDVLVGCPFDVPPEVLSPQALIARVLHYGLLIKVEGPFDSPWGVEFCGATVKGPASLPTSARPAKVFSRFVKYGANLNEKAEILSGIYPTLFGDPYWRHACHVARDILLGLGQPCRLATDADVMEALDPAVRR